MSRISDEKLLQELTLRLIENKESLKELKQLNEELTQANNKLMESEALKSHFIANMANEIQNPFSSILGLADSIMSVPKGKWETVIPMISHIYSEAFNLDFQFKNIFTAAILEAGQVTPEICKVDLLAIFSNLIDSFRFEAEKKNLKLNLIDKASGQTDYYFKTDPEKLRLVLSNLLSNAIKYSFQDAKIDISFSLENNHLTISIRDYGEGISKENLKIIFDRFKRADNGINSLNRGHGLGLSINKAVLEILNGTIEVNSTINKGSTFTIVIPQPDIEISGISGIDNEVIFKTDEDTSIF